MRGEGQRSVWDETRCKKREKEYLRCGIEIDS